jgi:hypothetical protein
LQSFPIIFTKGKSIKPYVIGLGGHLYRSDLIGSSALQAQ